MGESRFFFLPNHSKITAHWSEIYPDSPCPISSCSEDIELHSKEGYMLLLFREQAVLPIDRMVEPEDYDVAVENNRRFKDTFIALAKDEEEKELFKNLWSYQEPRSV